MLKGNKAQLFCQKIEKMMMMMMIENADYFHHVELHIMFNV